MNYWLMKSEPDEFSINDLKNKKNKANYTFSNKILIAFFTIRKNKIRIISVRGVNKKEKDLYLS